MAEGQIVENEQGKYYMSEDYTYKIEEKYGIEVRSSGLNLSGDIVKQLQLLKQHQINSLTINKPVGYDALKSHEIKSRKQVEDFKTSTFTHSDFEFLFNILEKIDCDLLELNCQQMKLLIKIMSWWRF